MTFSARLACASFAAASVLLAGASRADEAADIAAARTLGQDGVLLAEQGKCPQAIEKLGRAEKLHHAPTTALKLAECEIETGKIVDGTERLHRLLREPRSPNAPQVFVAAYAKAERVLAAAAPKIALLRIEVRAPSGVEVAVTVNGEPVPNVLVGDQRPTDPGTRQVRATAPGFLPASAEVTLKEGEAREVTLTLAPDPNARTEAPPPERAPLPGDDGGATTRTLAYVAFGVGAVGIGFGAAGGVITAGKASTLDANCRDKACPPSQRDTLDAAQTWSTVSTIGFVVGGVGIATGALLLLFGGSGRAAAKRTVQPVVGVSYVGLHGTL